MKKTITRFAGGFLTLTLLFGAGPGRGEAAPRQDPTGEGHRHHYVQGTVDRNVGGAVSIKTDKGTTRTVSLREIQAELSGALKKGDRVRLEVDEGNQIIDIDRITAGKSHPEPHATVTGTVERIDRAGRTVVLGLEDGRRLSYGLKDPAAGKMAMLKEGARVELTLDEESGLVNDILVR